MMEICSSQKEAEEQVIHILSTLDKKLFKACGELACQHDSFAETLDGARIIAYAPYWEQPQPAGKSKGKGNKGKKPKDIPNQQTNESSDAIKFAIVLSDSVFFPTGGGQPCDYGTITFALENKVKGEDQGQDQNRVQLIVQDAQNIQQACVLYCRPASNLAYQQILPFLTSSQQDQEPEQEQEQEEEQKQDEISIVQKIDWERRFDLMTQHSGQHLCSAVALSQYNIQTHTFSLGEKSNYSYIDFTIDESQSLDHAADIFALVETQVNQYIRENISMTPTWLDPKNDDDAAILREKARSRLLPKNLTGAIRLVEIGSSSNTDSHGGGLAGEVIDFNTCCGTHVPSLGHLQMIKFFRMERVKPTIMRVYFAAGKRLMRVMDDMYDTQAGITSMLSCTDAEQVKRVELLLEDKKVKEKEMKTVKDKLCNFHVKGVVDQCCVSSNSDGDGNGGSLAVVDLGDVDMGYMTMVSSAALEEIGRDDVILLLVGGEDKSDEGSFLLVGNKGIVDQVGKEVASIFEGRGGGRNGKFQGKGSKLRSFLGKVEEFLGEAMKEE